MENKDVVEVLLACRHVVNILATGQGISYHPPDMIKLSNYITEAVESLKDTSSPRHADAPRNTATGKA